MSMLDPDPARRVTAEDALAVLAGMRPVYTVGPVDADAAAADEPATSVVSVCFLTLASRPRSRRSSSYVVCCLVFLLL